MAASDLPAWVTKLGEFKGAKGDKGDTGTFASATATTLAAGASATASVSGPENAKVLELGIPRGNTGATGATGATGPAGQITSASASALAAGATPTVTLGGTATARTMAFGIPAGATGAQGPKGDKGDPGDATTPATTTGNGVVRLATQAEANAGASAPVPTAAVMKASFDAWEALLRPKRDNAVFIGASNVSTWATTLSDAEGWVKRDYSVGGTRVATGEWEQQIDAAIADSTLVKAKVGFIIIAGGGNDSYGTQPEVAAVKSTMASLLAKAKANFPAARIIVVPGLWNKDAVRGNLMSVATQMRDAALEATAEYVEQPWTWLMGLGSAVMADATHPNAAGYAIFTQYMREYLRGGSTRVQRTLGPGVTGLRSGFSIGTGGYLDCNCIDGVVYLQAAKLTKDSGNIATGDLPLDLPLWATLIRNQNLRHITGYIGPTMQWPVGIVVRDQSMGAAIIVRTVPSGAASNELHIPPQSWPLGQ